MFKQQGKEAVLRRAVSMLIVFAMVITMLPMTAFKADAAQRVTIKLYFDNNKGWENVYLFAGEGDNWTALTDGYPGSKLTQNTFGYYVYEITKSSTSKLNFIFSDGSTTNKTADLAISASTLSSDGDGVVEAWVNGNGSVTYSSPTALGGPQINGNQVTFTHSSSASSVALAGTMNGWNTTANMMTKNGSTFTYTMELNPGVYEYKFVENGSSWKNDASNSATIGSSGNSVLVVPGLVPESINTKKANEIILPAQLKYISRTNETLKTVTYTSNTAGVTVSGNVATVAGSFAGSKIDLTATTSDSYSAKVTVNLYEEQPITVKIHYDRSDGKEADWDAWVWADNQGGQGCSLALVNGEYVATYSLPAKDVLFTNNIKYIMRRGNWLEQEGDRVIDISNVVAGTVHAYVNADGSCRSDYSEAVLGTKVNKVTYNKIDNTVVITASGNLAGSANAFTIKKANGSTIDITDVRLMGKNYVLSLDEDISNVVSMLQNYILVYGGNEYYVTMPNLYDTDEFETEFTYDKDDLGATWTEAKTTFKVWAPTADNMQVKLYSTGSDAEAGSKVIGTYNMTKGTKGVWSLELTGNYKNVYYTYLTTIGTEVDESCDPYARTTGVNGQRAMIIDLDSTDPEGWSKDVSPNVGMSYTDVIIYELHIRDLSINEESGVKDEWRGKFLGLTQKGTTNKDKIPTGLDHIKDLGITHIHLLPVYDFGSIDETLSEEQKAADTSKQYGWGYDPLNYNVPEGSYSTNPYDGNVRVAEMKQMVQTLHKNNINVIMDVVYNHVQDAGTFGFNEIVPNYFSRTNADGSYSNGSGCGNDTASERAMVRKYIVDSVKYWADEYHIDGFRFDLVGLLDAETINQVVNEVHKTHPYVIFYGEGWHMYTSVKPSDTIMAEQGNAWATPDFAYFSDTFRDFIKGEGGSTWGYIQGATEGDQEGMLMSCFTANTDWINNPTQVINYASCHDNYTLMDKINASRGEGSAYAASFTDRIKMNNLAAAIYLTSEGIPLIHAGEELLRTKVDSNGNIIHNSYNSPDYINSLKWGDLDLAQYQQVRDYYKGLIEFRKNHAALRLTTKTAVNNNVESIWVEDNVVMFKINGKANIPTEVADEILIIFNSNASAKTFSIYDKGASTGTWNVCVNDQKAGTDVLSTVTNGQVTVPAISTLILVKGQTVDNNSIYLKASVSDKGDENVIHVDSVTGFSYSARTYNSVTLKWNKNASANGYVIEQYKGGKWTVIKTITGNTTTSHKVTGLNPGTSYQFRIKAFINDESSKVYGATTTATIKTLELIDLSKATITIGQPSFGYTGEYIKPVVTVKVNVDGKTKTLTNWVDYKVNYKNFKNPGTATITVVGRGSYTGEKSMTFTIRPVDISKCTVTINQPSFGYTGEYIKPVVTVKAKINGKTVTLTNWKDYKVTYKNFKNPGVATITVSGRGITSGTKSLTFQIRPAQVKNIKYVGKSTSYVNFKWDKCVGVTGYEVYRATSKTGTYSKVGTVATTSYKNTGLKKGTTYYYKVRAYKTVGSTKIYGNYSAIYTIATK